MDEIAILVDAVISQERAIVPLDDPLCTLAFYLLFLDSILHDADISSSSYTSTLVGSESPRTHIRFPNTRPNDVPSSSLPTLRLPDRPVLILCESVTDVCRISDTLRLKTPFDIAHVTASPKPSQIALLQSSLRTKHVIVMTFHTYRDVKSIVGDVRWLVLDHTHVNDIDVNIGTRILKLGSTKSCDEKWSVIPVPPVLKRKTSNTQFEVVEYTASSCGPSKYEVMYREAIAALNYSQNVNKTLEKLKNVIENVARKFGYFCAYKMARNVALDFGGRKRKRDDEENTHDFNDLTNEDVIMKEDVSNLILTLWRYIAAQKRKGGKVVVHVEKRIVASCLHDLIGCLSKQYQNYVTACCFDYGSSTQNAQNDVDVVIASGFREEDVKWTSFSHLFLSPDSKIINTMKESNTRVVLFVESSSLYHISQLLQSLSNTLDSDSEHTRVFEEIKEACGETQENAEISIGSTTLSSTTAFRILHQYLSDSQSNFPSPSLPSSFSSSFFSSSTSKCKDTKWGYTATLTFPTYVPFFSKSHTSSIRATPKLALDEVALRVCWSLYSIGALTMGRTDLDNQESVGVYEPAIPRHIDAAYGKWGGSGEEKTIHVSEMIDVILKGRCGGNNGNGDKEGYVTVLRFSGGRGLWNQKSFALVTHMKIPDIPDYEFSVDNIGDLRVSFQCINEPRRFSANEWSMIDKCHIWLFGYCLRISGKDFSNAALPEAIQRRSYKIAPILISENGAWEFDWQFLRKNLYSELQELTPCLRDLKEKLGIRTWTNVESGQKLEIVKALKNMVFITKHNGFRYFFVSVRWDLFSHSQLNFNVDHEGIKTFADYFQHTCQKPMSHVDLPLVEVRHAPNVKNLRNKKIDASTQNQSMTLLLVPDAVHCLNFDNRYFEFALWMPSILNHLETFLLMDELRLFVPILQPIPLSMLYEACCAVSVREDINYDRFETLGDALLKMSVSIDIFKSSTAHTEGDMTDQRSKIISNAHLFQKALSHGLHHFILTMPFFPRQWSPPETMPWKPPRKRDALLKSYSVPTAYRSIGNKSLADIVESLVAACYLTGEYELSTSFMCHFGLLKRPLELTPGTYCENLDEKSPWFHVESVLGYRFKNEELIQRAFCHNSSVAHTNESYEQMEFLGDAALDWLTVRYFFENYRSCQSGALSALKQVAVSNETFGRLLVEWNLHEQIQCDVVSVNETIADFVTWYKSGHENDPPHELEHEPPKILGDVFESICGALLVDSGFDIQLLSKTFMKLCGGFLKKHCDPEVVRKNPVRLFYEEAVQRGYSANDITFEFRRYGASQHCCVYVKNELLAEKTATGYSAVKRGAALIALEKIKTLSG